MFALACSNMYRDKVMTPPGTGSTFVGVGDFSVVAMKTRVRASRCVAAAVAMPGLRQVDGPTKALLFEQAHTRQHFGNDMV